MAEQGGDAAGAFGHPGLDVAPEQAGQDGGRAAGADGGHHLAPVDQGGGVEIAQLRAVDYVHGNMGGAGGGGAGPGLALLGDRHEGQRRALVDGGIGAGGGVQPQHLGRRALEQSRLGVRRFAVADDDHALARQGEIGREGVHCRVLALALRCLGAGLMVDPC